MSGDKASQHTTIVTHQPGQMAPPPLPVMNHMPVMIPGQVYKPVGGIEELAFTSTFYVRQHIEVAEVVCGCETPNNYTILNTMGLPTFHLKEQTDECTVLCFGTERCFQFQLLDNFGHVVLLLERTCASCCCGVLCCGCCGNSVVVSLPDGTLLGTAHQRCACDPTFEVMDANNKLVFTIKGPSCGNCCPCCVCGTVLFEIFDGSQRIGAIHKKWSGVLQELFTDADMFGAEFPINLDIYLKALLFGALLLIDFVHFEHGEGLLCKVLHICNSISGH